MHTSDWIEWHARYVQMLSWWEELTKIPSHVDHQEFTQKVHISFEVPKICNWVKKVDNYYAKLPAHPLIGKHHFLLPKDVRFGTQDIHFRQLHHTIAYTRTLQHWAEKVHPPVPGQPHHLVRSVQELWWAIEPLICLEEEEVFAIMVPSNWMEVTSPQSTETIPQESQKSHTQSSWVHLRGSLSVTHSEGWPATTATWATTMVEALATPLWEFMQHKPTSESWPLCPLPGFADITKTLEWEEPVENGLLSVITSIPTEEAIDTYKVVEMNMMANKPIWNQTMGEMSVDIQVCSGGIMGLGLKPKVEKHPSLTLHELSDSDS